MTPKTTTTRAATTKPATTRTATVTTITSRLRVDWPACEAAGLCAELLPELVTLDEWGYPVVAGPVTAETLAAAQEAVRYCPRSALRLIR